MIKSVPFTLLFVLLSTSLRLVPVRGQFGVGDPDQGGGAKHQIPDDVLAEGLKGRSRNTNKVEDDDIQYMTEQNAAEMEALILQAKADPDTMRIVTKLKTDMNAEIEELKQQSSEDVLGGMMRAMEELKMLDILFQNKERAVRVMDEEGMIKPELLGTYQQNPDLLKEETRRGMYMQFVSLAVVAGFL